MKKFIFTFVLALLACPIFASTGLIYNTAIETSSLNTTPVRQEVKAKFSNTLGDNIVDISFRITKGNSTCTEDITVLVTIDHGEGNKPRYEHHSVTYFNVPCGSGPGLGQAVKKRTEERQQGPQ